MRAIFVLRARDVHLATVLPLMSALLVEDVGFIGRRTASP
jgi:hypothetical protein